MEWSPTILSDDDYRRAALQCARCAVALLHHRALLRLSPGELTASLEWPARPDTSAASHSSRSPNLAQP